MILLSPKMVGYLSPTFWLCSVGRMRPAFLDAAPIAGLWGIFHKGSLPFQNKQFNMASFFGSMAKLHHLDICSCLVSFTDFLLCVCVNNPGDVEQQWFHCSAEPGLLYPDIRRMFYLIYISIYLSGWRQCTWNYQRITTLLSKTVNLIFPKATSYNLPTTCTLIQFGTSIKIMSCLLHSSGWSRVALSLSAGSIACCFFTSGS